MKLLLFLLFLLPNVALSQTVKVAVIDTGIKKEIMNKVKLCSFGHKDFTNTTMFDENGHGTNITGLIQKYAGNANFCFIIIKAFQKTSSGWVSRLTESIRYAASINADVIHISAGGPGYSFAEHEAVLGALNRGIVMITASGNFNAKLDANKCNFYPACYDGRIYVVGNIGGGSNFGEVVDITINGNHKTAFGITLSGSSQSAAIFTGQTVGSL